MRTLRKLWYVNPVRDYLQNRRQSRYTAFDRMRQQSDFRRFKGNGTVLDSIFFTLRNLWLAR